MRTALIGKTRYAVEVCDCCGKEGLSLDPDVLMPFLPPGWKAVGVNGAHMRTCGEACARQAFEMLLPSTTLQPKNPLPEPARGEDDPM